VNGDAIYNGAMDNASGVATLLVVARMLREGGVPGRSVVFLACTGEANRGGIAMRDVVANVNLDMFLPIVPLQIVRGYGVGESSLAGDLAAVAKELNIAVQDDPEPERNIFIRSDQYSFIQKGVPALFLSGGYAAEHALLRNSLPVRASAVEGRSPTPLLFSASV
jgi:Zn-dependent M28 family amino/carboxypeptidase